MKLLVTGVTRTGNLGGTAMLCALEDTLADHIDDFALASVLPVSDKKKNGPDHAQIVDCDYRKLLLFAAPLCVVLWPFRHLQLVRSFLSHLPVLKHFANCDVVADISGIAFVDGRGLPLLWYNIAVILPGLYFNKPVLKLSQAMGPFNNYLNKKAAYLMLSRCSSVAARGKTSLDYIRGLGIENSQYYPDVSFGLNISDEVYARAEAVINNGQQDDIPLVMIAPSMVVARLCAKHNIDLEELLALAMVELHEQGYRLALLAHATDTGIAKNNDLTLVRGLAGRMAKLNIPVKELDPDGDPRLARAFASKADVFIACRFHTLIAALSQAVPVFTIGWSHKYLEASQPFGMADFSVDASEITHELVVKSVHQLYESQQSTVPKMCKAAEASYTDARTGIFKVIAS